MIVFRQQNKFELTGEKFDNTSATLIFKFDYGPLKVVCIRTMRWRISSTD